MFFSYLFYRFLTVPLALLLLKVFRPILPSKIRLMITEREELIYQTLPARPIWIHAASGEIEYAKSVIRELKKARPEIPILVTYFSPSAKRLIQNFPGVDAILPLPWDSPKEIQRFLSFYRPRLGLFARTDVWAVLATECKNQNIPLILFSATISENSSRLKFGVRSLFRWTLNQLSMIHVVSTADAAVLEFLKIRTPIQISGDTRFDQVLFRLQNFKNTLHLRQNQNHFLFLLGSTWPQDENALIPALSKLSLENLDLVIVPHELNPAHLNSLNQLILDQGMTPLLLSKLSSPLVARKSKEVLIVDQVGVLADLYLQADLAFVGGSFKDKVHSVMEPLAAGVPVLVGPFHQNNREALEFKKKPLKNGLFAVTEVTSTTDIQTAIANWVQNQNSSRIEIQAQVLARTGASKRVVQWVEAHLP